MISLKPTVGKHLHFVFTDRIKLLSLLFRNIYIRSIEHNHKPLKLTCPQLFLSVRQLSHKRGDIHSTKSFSETHCVPLRNWWTDKVFSEISSCFSIWTPSYYLSFIFTFAPIDKWWEFLSKKKFCVYVNQNELTGIAYINVIGFSFVCFHSLLSYLYFNV